MSEHPNSHPEEIKQSVVVEAGATGGWLLPLSILIGCLVIAGSIVYANKKTVSQLENMSFGGGSGAAVAGQAGNQQPAGNVAPREVKLSLRGDAPVIGKGKGKVTLVEFSDFQCPFCQRFFQDSLASLKSKYVDSGKVKFVFQHFPLPFHVNAQKSAEAGECAARQGKFEAYHDILFTRGKSDGAGLGVDDLKKYASEAGLNTSRFNSCLDNGEAVDIVKKDMAQGASLGVTGTPSFAIVKDGNFTFDAAAIASAVAQNQNIVKLSNGNVFIVGALPATAFEQALDEMLK